MSITKINLLLLALLIVLGTSSCKKEAATIDISTCKVVSETDNTGKEAYTYDSYGRITKREYFDLFGASGGFTTYTYGYNTLYLASGTYKDTIHLNINGQYGSHYGSQYNDFVYYNSSGLIDSVVLRTPNANTTRIVFACKYNADGNLSELNAYDTYKPWYKKTFTYSTEKNIVNYCPQSLFWTGGWAPGAVEDLKFQSKQFYGNTISNLLPSRIDFQQYDQNTSAPIYSSYADFTYTKDKDGKITAITETSNTATNPITTTIEYSCP